MNMKPYLKKRRVSFKVKKINPESVIPKKSFEPSEAQQFAHSIAAEICGLLPYEKKTMDLIRSDNMKRARQFLKKRLGSLKRAEKKFEELYNKCH